MNKKGLAQGKLNSLFTSGREFLERGRRRAERVLKIFHYQQDKEILKINLGTEIEENSSTHFKRTVQQKWHKF